MILCSRQWGEAEAVQWHVRERGQNGGGLEGAQRGRRTCPAGRLQRQWAMTRTRQDQCVSIQSGGALNHLPRSLGVFNKKKKKGSFLVVAVVPSSYQSLMFKRLELYSFHIFQSNAQLISKPCRFALRNAVSICPFCACHPATWWLLNSI